jgi:hypothetical protein
MVQLKTVLLHIVAQKSQRGTPSRVAMSDDDAWRNSFMSGGSFFCHDTIMTPSIASPANRSKADNSSVNGVFCTNESSIILLIALDAVCSTFILSHHVQRKQYWLARFSAQTRFLESPAISRGAAITPKESSKAKYKRVYG